MPIPLRTISVEQLSALLQINESHFIDLKSIDIAPSGLTKTAAAFCNTSGGELFVGIEEIEGEQGKGTKLEWLRRSRGRQRTCPSH